MGLVDESKPRLVIQCDCDNSECCGLEATEKPSKEPPTETPTEPEQAEVAIGMCSCSRSFSGNYINWQTCGEGYALTPGGHFSNTAGVVAAHRVRKKASAGIGKPKMPTILDLKFVAVEFLKMIH